MADAKVLSYILGSVDSSIALSLRSFPTSAAVWKHLQTTYSNISTSRLFDLEYALANLSQGELDVNSYYLAADNLWTEIDLLSASMLSTAAHVEIQAERRRARSFQFLMRLRPEFEQIRSQLLSGNKTEMSEIIGELKRAETRLRTQAQLDNLSSPNAPGTVFAAGKFKPQFFSNNSKSSTDASRNNSTGANLDFELAIMLVRVGTRRGSAIWFMIQSWVRMLLQRQSQLCLLLLIPTTSPLLRWSKLCKH
ncbi:hypothetical protein LINPERPRIM_LOCUS24577 [Linum perenne]